MLIIFGVLSFSSVQALSFKRFIVFQDVLPPNE